MFINTPIIMSKGFWRWYLNIRKQYPQSIETHEENQRKYNQLLRCHGKLQGIEETTQENRQ